MDKNFAWIGDKAFFDSPTLRSGISIIKDAKSRSPTSGFGGIMRRESNLERKDVPTTEAKRKQIIEDYTDNSRKVEKKSLKGDEYRWYNYGMFNPDSPLLLIWHILTSIVISYLELLYAYQLAFSNFHPNFDYHYKLIIIASNAVLLLDILLLFNTKYYDKGSLVHSRKRIVMHVLKDAFLMRLVPFAGIVFRTVLKFETPEHLVFTQNVLDCLFMLKISDIFLTIDKFVVIFKVSQLMINLTHLLNLLFRLIFMLHWATCIWYYYLTLGYIF